MKKTLLILIIVLSNNIFAQDITQSEFDKINRDVWTSLLKQTQPFDIILFSNNFDISEEDREKIESVFVGKEIVFNEGDKPINLIYPYYLKTSDTENFKLTIFAYTRLPKRENEDFNRAKYYFVLTLKVSIKNDSVVYDDTKLLVSKEKIIKWFLDGYDSYLEKTRPVYKKYDFTPPPPPLPPIELK